MIARRLFVVAVALSMSFAFVAAQEKGEKQAGKKPAKEAAGCCASMTKAPAGSRDACEGKEGKMVKGKKAGADGCCDHAAMTRVEGKKSAAPAPVPPKDKE